LLFNLTADPGEMLNLALLMPSLASAMEKTLRGVLDYPRVAMEVAQYNKDSFVAWQKKAGADWLHIMETQVPQWRTSWPKGGAASAQAVSEWLASPTKIHACRNASAWPGVVVI